MDCIGTKNLRQVFELKVKQFTDREAIVFEDRDGNVTRYTYQQFDDMVNKYANILLSKGIKKGDKVIVHLLNSPEYLFVTGGINKIQGISGLINFNQKKIG